MLPSKKKSLIISFIFISIILITVLLLSIFLGPIASLIGLFSIFIFLILFILFKKDDKKWYKILNQRNMNHYIKI